MKPFSNPYYHGPKSDHFDGLHFGNPGGGTPARLGAVLKWQLGGGRQAWPERYPSPYPADRPPRSVGDDRARLVHVGHASFLLQTGGLNILLDPHWSDRCAPSQRFGPKRRQPPGIAFDDLPRIDVVCISHSHYDHMDRTTIQRLHRRDRPRFVVPLGNDRLLRGFCRDIDVEAFDWHETLALNGAVAVTLDPTHHWGARGVFDRRMTLWASFAFQTPAGLVYYVGDSGFHGGLGYRNARQRFGPPKLAILPIGAYLPRFIMQDHHQDPDEAVRAARFLEAEMAVGSHWGCWQLTDEAVEDPLRRLAAALTKWEVPAERFVAAQPGMVVELPHEIAAPPIRPLAVTPETTAPTPY